MNIPTPTCIRIREDARDTCTAEKIYPFCSWPDIEEVLSGWKIIMSNYKKFSIKVFQNFFCDHPGARNFFPNYARLHEEELEHNEDFKTHAYAMMKGLHTAMITLTGLYESDFEILPIIAKTHIKRGIPFQAMSELKDTLFFTCCDFLKLTKRQKISWKRVIQFIFDNYLLHPYTEFKRANFFFLLHYFLDSFPFLP